MSRTWFIALAWVVVLVSAPAAAQDGGVVTCTDPLVRWPEEVTPADTAREVSLDAPVRVRYTPGYFEPGGPGGDPARLITVERCADGCFLPCTEDEPAEFVPGRAQVLSGRELFFFPDEQWEPNQAYRGVARGEDGDLPFSFCTGTTTDTTPPDLRGLDRVTSTPVEPRCDAPEGGYRIAAFFPPADDIIGPRASIEYLLFQTRGPGIEEPVLRTTIRNFATEMHTMAFVLPPHQAGDVICVRVAAIDGRGNVDWSDARPEVDCVDPVQGNFFYSLCSVSAAGAPATSLPAVLAPLALAWIVSRRRARR